MSSKAKTLARRLLRENRGTRTKTGKPWRTIASDDYGDRIAAGTLCRFALSEGEWLPKDKELQILLGVKSERKPKPQQPKALFDMATSTLRAALVNRREMPPPDPRILREFQRLGWIQKTKAAR